MHPKILCGDALSVLKTLPDQSVNCCITSPPYFGLRNYGIDGQIGLESTIDQYVQKLVDVFHEVHRVLRDDGTLWVNLGDSYNAGRNGGHPGGKKQWKPEQKKYQERSGANVEGLKPKDLIGVPWRVAFALQKDGWILRQDIIWHKPGPMPESCQDRCTRSHEYLFLLAKNNKYYYDAEAIKEKAKYGEHHAKYQGTYHRHKIESMQKDGATNGEAYQCGLQNPAKNPLKRNKRSVWTVQTASYDGAHFAVFPPALIEPCVLAGCPVDGVVLDPFAGSGTTGMVAKQQGRNSVLIELNPQYVKLIEERCAEVQSGNLFTV